MAIERGSQIEVIVDIKSKYSSFSVVKKGTIGAVIDFFNGLYHIEDDGGGIFNAYLYQIKEVKTR